MAQRAQRAKLWQEKAIEEEKISIKEELDTALRRGDEKECLQLALRRIAELENDGEARGRLRRYIFVISALVHHERYGGLSTAQIRALSDIALAIIRVFHIKPGFSKAARLYADLRLVLSQIYRKDGEHWLAAWEQQLATHFARSTPAIDQGFQALAIATRALRLGHAPLAIRSLLAAEAHQLSPELLVRIRFERVRALRLAGSPGEAEALAAETERLPGVTPAIRIDLEWEAMCRTAQSSGDLGPLVAAVRSGHPHAQINYQIEASLWTKAAASLEWMKRLPPMRSVSMKELKPDGLSFIYSCARQLKDCYDYEIPLATRLEQLGKLLTRTHLIVTVDCELLLWAAAARWLSRSKSFHLASLVFSEYQASSLRLSGGASKDSLGLLSDLCERDWFAGEDETEPESDETHSTNGAAT